MNNFNNSKFQNRPFESLAQMRKGGKNNNSVEHRQSRYPTLPSLLRVGRDGEDHVNIYTYGETDLGVMLSIDSEIPFVHEDFGSFNTIEGLRLWLHSVDNDNAFRTLDGVSARRYSKNIRQSRYVPNLAFHVLTATWNKIKQNVRLFDKIKKNDLNFDCYYYSKPVGVRQADANRVLTRMRPSYAPWFVEGMNIISDAIKNDKEPDLSYFIDNQEELDDLKSRINDMKQDSDRVRQRMHAYYENRNKNKPKTKPKNNNKPEENQGQENEQTSIESKDSQNIQESNQNDEVQSGSESFNTESEQEVQNEVKVENYVVMTTEIAQHNEIVVNTEPSFVFVDKSSI